MINLNAPGFRVGVISALLLASPLAPVARAEKKDPVVLRFAVMGGCRMGTKELRKQGSSNPSSANVPQLKQTLADVAALSRAPSIFFLTGDIVDNLVADNGQTLQSQLTAWRALVAASPLWGRTELELMPGNHEMLQIPGEKPEVPNPATPRIWESFVSEPGLNASAGNGPLAKSPLGQADQLAADQSRSTFSFNRAGVHFLCVNTDTPTTAIDPTTQKSFAGWIPIHWIKADIEAAQANPAISTILMLGHKPLLDAEASEEKSPILDTPPYNLSDQLRALFLASSKFRAYLTGHEHLWEAHQIGGSSSPWEIIIGNGGSKLSGHWVKRGHNYFGFTIVTVHAGGRIEVENYRRPGPADPKDYADPKTQPAQPDKKKLTL